MNKDENTLSTEQLAFLMAANQQLFAAAAAAAANVPPPHLPKPSPATQPSQVPALTPDHLQNNMMLSWLASLSAFQSLQKPQHLENQQHHYYPSATSAYPSTNAVFDHTGPPGKAEPTYVNAKQYHRILKRRQSRQVLEAYFARTRREREEKPYMHESRHRHAMKRPRGPGGRFLTKSEIDKLKREPRTFDEGMSSFKKRQCEGAL